MTVDAALFADFKTAPLKHQMRELEISMELPARALLWQMRTGKTKVCIDTACHLYQKGEIDAVLIIAPNGVHENWLNEIAKHAWDSIEHDMWRWRTDLVMNGTQREVFQRLLTTKASLPWFSFSSHASIMTRDDVRKHIKRIVNRRKRIMTVFDESHDFRSAGSLRSAMARAIARKSKYRRILTGTVVDNSFLHAWGQYELLRKGALGFERYNEFKKRYSEHARVKNKTTGKFYWKCTGYKNVDELQRSMAVMSSVVRRQDCDDLPDLEESTKMFEMSEQQRDIFRVLMDDFRVEIENDLIDIGEMTMRLIKLQQVSSGFIRDKHGRDKRIPGPNPRLEAMLEEVEATQEKVIIWCAFHRDMDYCVKVLENAGHKVAQYHGRTSMDDKARVRRLFAAGEENDYKALVGFPTLGVDFSAAGKIIWYSHIFDAVLRRQADERATAIKGQNVKVVNLVGSRVDKYILKNLRRKKSQAEFMSREGLLELIKDLYLSGGAIPTDEQ